MLVILPDSCVSVIACDAVKRENPVVPVNVMIPVDGWIVATLVLVEAYAIGAELLLVGAVIILNGESVFIFLVATTNDDEDKLFAASSPRLISSVHDIDDDAYWAVSALVAVIVVVPIPTILTTPVLEFTCANDELPDEYNNDPLPSFDATTVKLGSA